MKKKLLFTVMGIICFAFITKSQDLTINQFNLGYDYNPSTGVISDLWFDVMNIDDYEDVDWSFDVAILLSDPGDPYTIFLADSYELSGLSASSSVPFTDWDIDLNNVSDLPSGDYRLGICVDYDEDISETDEDNNYYYISPAGNNLTFNGGSGIDDVEKISAVLNQNYPNPVINITLLSFSIKEKGVVNLSIYDITGKLVNTIVNQELNIGEHNYMFDISNMESGIYYYSLHVNNTVQTKKLVVQ